MSDAAGSPTRPAPFVWGLAAGVVGTILLVLLIVVIARDDSPNADAISASGTTSTVTSSVDGAPPGPTDSGAGEHDHAHDPAAREDPNAPRVQGSAGPANDHPQDAPDVAHVTCPEATVRVRTAVELQAALDAATPGAVIAIADGTYLGKFVATVKATPERPIFLCGGPGAILDGEGIKEGYGLHLRGAEHWRIVGFTVRNTQKGVMADGVTGCVIQDLTVTDIGDEAIHLRSHSTRNAVLHNTIRRTGLRRDKFGEGVYIGSATSNWQTYTQGGPDRSDFNVVHGNDIAETSSEAIDVKEGTTGGRIHGNTLDGTGMTGADSLMDVKGNDNVIQGNVGRHGVEEGFQTHRILEGWGQNNTFTENTIDVDGGGNHISIHDAQQTHNKVRCDNHTASGQPIRSNVSCG